MKILFLYALLIGFIQSEKTIFPKKHSQQGVQKKHIEHVNGNNKHVHVNDFPKKMIPAVNVHGGRSIQALRAREILLRRLQQAALSKRNPKLRLKRAHKSRRDRRKARRQSKHNGSTHETNISQTAKDSSNSKGKRNTENARKNRSKNQRNHAKSHPKNRPKNRTKDPRTRAQMGHITSRIRRVLSNESKGRTFGKRGSMFGNSGSSSPRHERVKVNPCFGRRLGTIDRSWMRGCNPQLHGSG